MIFNTMEAETQALIKKVAFNPEAFTLYGWAKKKGYLEKDKDFGDFVNYCITLAMGKLFGARVGIIIDDENSLLGLVKERNKQLGIEYTS